MKNRIVEERRQIYFYDYKEKNHKSFSVNLQDKRSDEDLIEEYLSNEQYYNNLEDVRKQGFFEKDGKMSFKGNRTFIHLKSEYFEKNTKLIQFGTIEKGEIRLSLSDEACDDIVFLSEIIKSLPVLIDCYIGCISLPTYLNKFIRNVDRNKKIDTQLIQVIWDNCTYLDYPEIYKLDFSDFKTSNKNIYNYLLNKKNENKFNL